MISQSYFPFTGAVSDLPKISVTDAQTESHTISSGKSGVIFMNIKTGGICFWGGSTIDPANNRGIEFFPGEKMQFDKVKSDFKIYFKCAAGISTDILVNEYA